MKLDARALQAAIDACHQSGGSTVLIPAGRYLTGSLFLRSQVTLRLDAGATLLGSTKLDDYQVKIPALRSFTDNYTDRALIYGEDLEGVAIEGHGVIDGQGAAFKGKQKVRSFWCGSWLAGKWPCAASPSRIRLCGCSITWLATAC